MKLFYKFIIVACTLISAGVLTGCNEANTASSNTSKAADNFEIDRRIIFYNGITNEIMLQVIGRCSIKDQAGQLEVICKTGDSEYVKHFLGLSNNVTYFAEQLGAKKVSGFRYEFNVRPEAILPTMKLRTSTSAEVPDNYKKVE